jgi:hypothetical protein
MKISLTLSDLRTKKDRKLPGEPRPFVPRSSVRNLTPPQQLAPDGSITSPRDHEVSRGDPLLLRIRELEAECEALRAQLEDRK